MDSEARKTRQVAALGRPFGLGMLYDCRQDSFVPGLTLWDCKDLEKDQRERPQPNSDFQIVASESIDDKSSALNVDASLKASFLGGMVEVGGSAKYLNDQKASKNEARVTLKYKTTTKFQELSMSHLGRGNVKHPDVFEAGLATHVVTGILYGAQAFFVFGCEKSEEESRQDIQGNLQVMIKKIPCLSIEGKGKLSMKDEDVEKVEKFSCKFHGDFLLEKTPTTFQDAVEVYQSLPRLLGANGENAVPVQVWLLPLTNLDSKAAKLVRQISVRLVQQAQRVLEDFSELEMRCNDVLNTPAAQQFPQIVKKIKRFKEMCAEFKLEFQRILATKLPSIRGGGEEEAVLAEVLKKKLSSPFNSNSLSEWMDCKEREIYTMMSFTNKMKNTKILPSQSDLYKEVLSVEHALCFVFTSLGSDEPYLSALSEYLKGTQPADPQDPNTRDVEKEQWYASKEVMDGMIHKVKLFSDFAEANKENKNVKFLTAGLTDKTHKGSTIYLYKDGSSVSENFEPPSKPESVTAADIKHHSVTLKISPPRYGAESITSYSVEFCVRGEDGWRQEEGTKAGEATVSDLRPNTEYVFRCRAVTSAGVGPAFVSDPIRTSPCSPPGNLHAESSLCEISVSWEKPAEVGQDVQIVYYTVKYAATEEGVSEEDLQWKQIKSETQTVIVSMLQSDTEYAVRVVCDCGEAGRSKESVSVVCRTPDTYLLLLNEILHDFPDLETKGNKALRSTTVRQFPQIGEKLETFKSLCMKFKPVLLQKLREKVSLVLSRAEKEYAIMSMLEMRNTSSFSETNLRMWMDAKEKEIQVVQSTANEMKNTEIIPSKDVFEEKMNSTKYVLSFVFTSLGDAEVYLSALADFTNQSDVERPPGPQTDLTKWEPWFKEKGGEMSQKATLFSDFAEANKENKNVKFLTAGLTDKTHKGSTIYLYKDGSSVSEDFEPPSKPESVTAADIKHHSVTLKISPPRYGAESITSYSVEFCVRGEDGWRQEEGTKAGEATVSDLRPNTEYVFRCRAVTSAGVGPAFVSDPIRTSGKRLSDAK
ncbi:uncharacterized protein [Leuresthes tenuis]|uniref:uncharacterized protein n=1 Tax=Leuresthes tenuis TaxID=355514 RepID=UPI003B513305